MTELQVGESISAPPERVFALATDLEHAPDQIQGIESIEVLTDGPFRVGTRWRETRVMMGKQATEEMTVTAVEPGRSYTCEAHSSGCLYVSGLTCQPEGEGTRATFRFIGRPETFTARFMMTLMAPLQGMMLRMVRKCFQADLADLRRAAETGGEPDSDRSNH